MLHQKLALLDGKNGEVDQIALYAFSEAVNGLAFHLCFVDRDLLQCDCRISSRPHLRAVRQSRRSHPLSEAIPRTGRKLHKASGHQPRRQYIASFEQHVSVINESFFEEFNILTIINLFTWLYCA